MEGDQAYIKNTIHFHKNKENYGHTTKAQPNKVASSLTN